VLPEWIGMGQVGSPALSPDGKSLYVTSYTYSVSGGPLPQPSTFRHCVKLTVENTYGVWGREARRTR